MVDDLPDTYEEWLAGAERRLAEVRHLYGEVEKVIIRPDEFAQFCRETGLPANGMTRSILAGRPSAEELEAAYQAQQKQD